MPDSSAFLRSRRRWRIGIVVVPIAVALALVAWAVLIAAPSARDGIRVEPRWFRCDGKPVPYTIQNGDDNSPFNDPLPAFEVPLEDYELCQMQVTVINDGAHTVHIGDADFAAMSPGEGGGFPLELTDNGAEFANDPEAS
jgi:hypothetical protein